MEYKIEVDNEEQLTLLKEKCMKCKVILLDLWDKHPLQNPSLFNKRQKERFTKELLQMINDWNDEKVNLEFNSVVTDRIFASGQDISNYPVYQSSVPEHSHLYKNHQEV